MGNSLGAFWAFVESTGDLRTVAHSTARVFTEVPSQVHVKAAFSLRHESGSPGTLAIAGSVHLGGLSAEILYRKSQEFDRGAGLGRLVHLSPVPADRAAATIVTGGHAIPIAPQHVSLTSHSDTDLWMRLSDPAPAREHPRMEHFVGRCNGRPLTFERDLPAQVTLDAHFTPESFGERTSVEIGGQLRFEQPVSVGLVLRGPDDKPLAASDSFDSELVLLPAGSTVPIRKQVAWGKAGPNPWISLRILQQSGRVVGDEHRLGRAVQMYGGRARMA